MRSRSIHLDSNPRILIIARQGLGDALFFSPTLERLRSRLPGARIDVLVEDGGAEGIFRHSRLCDYVYRVQPGILGCAFRQLIELRRVRYQVALVEFPSGYRSALIARLLGIPVRVGHCLKGWLAGMRLFLTHMPKADLRIHRTVNNLNLLGPLGLHQEDNDHVRIQVTLDPGKREAAARFLAGHKISGTLVGMHPGSGPRAAAGPGTSAPSRQQGPPSTARVIVERRWPAEKYLELARRICSGSKVQILVFGVQGEELVVGKITEGLHGRATAVLGLDLELAAALIERCSLFVAGDSGPLHLANALGVPAVGVYGPTDPQFAGPFNPGGETVTLGIECSPCFKFSPFWHCIHETNLCLQNLETPVVYRACQAVLQRQVPSPV